MKRRTIGVEIEMTGLTRPQAAQVVASYFGTTATRVNANLSTAADNQGREWKVVYDSSIRVDGGEGCELVTPILKWEDITTLQEIIRKLRKAGAKVNETCGLHVHVGSAGMTAQAIRNLVNNVASHEELLYKALNVHENRKRYCKPTDERFLQELNAKKPATLEELGEIWYQRPAGRFPTNHYDSSRYTIVNLHALFTKGTIEFRIYNGTLHAGEVKTAIQLSCALIAFAKASTRTLLKRITTNNDKFTMRTWLVRMGLSGEEFKTARHHMIKHLEGNAAWRYAV